MSSCTSESPGHVVKVFTSLRDMNCDWDALRVSRALLLVYLITTLGALESTDCVVKGFQLSNATNLIETYCAWPTDTNSHWRRIFNLKTRWVHCMLHTSPHVDCELVCEMMLIKEWYRSFVSVAGSPVAERRLTRAFLTHSHCNRRCRIQHTQTNRRCSQQPLC